MQMQNFLLLLLVLSVRPQISVNLSVVRDVCQEDFRYRFSEWHIPPGKHDHGKNDVFGELVVEG